MKPLFFSDQDAFRTWLAQNHAQETELLVGFYKVGSGKPSMSWSQSVDQALCFGWIDGVRRSIDHESYCIRFTPRKANSIWSTVNIRKIEELTTQGLMQPAGLAAFIKRKEAKSGIYSYEKEPVALSPAYLERFKANTQAWAFFQSQSPSYRKKSTNWVMSAKQAATQEKRLAALISACAVGRKV